MGDALADVRVAVSARHEAETAYRAALQAARDAGHSGGAIAAVAGTTRQNVLKLTDNPATTGVALEARLAELDARWDRFVDALAARFTHPDAKREQLARNTYNGIEARKHARAVQASRARGLGVATASRPRRRETVAVEARRLAETYALEFLERHRVEPVAVQVLAELDDAAALREQLTTRRDASIAWLHD